MYAGVVLVNFLFHYEPQTAPENWRESWADNARQGPSQMSN